MQPTMKSWQLIAVVGDALQVRREKKKNKKKKPPNAVWGKESQSGRGRDGEQAASASAS